jgi:hypothetical protein
VHPQGRHRYYELAGPEVGALIEALARVSPAAPVRSLRQGTRAEALRSARTCYDHLAGRLGVSVFAALLERGLATGGAGIHRLDGGGGDRLSSAGHDLDYRLTPAGQEHLGELGLEVPFPSGDGTVPLRYCVDWTEQRHHLSGAVGRSLTTRLLDLGRLQRSDRSRAVHVTDLGRRELPRRLGVQV